MLNCVTSQVLPAAAFGDEEVEELADEAAEDEEVCCQ